MAINIDTQNIDLYPGIIKRVTVDQATITPIGYDGDEQFVIKVSTSAYSDNDTNTTIQALYITDFDIGWCKSSGLAGISGKFALDATHNKLRIKLDNTSVGEDGSGYYTVTLNYDDDGLSISGDVVAEDIEAKIRAITCVTADAGYQLAYKNAAVEFKDGRFWITSGTIGRYYTGDYRSSVKVAASATNDCSVLLGFNLAITSEDIASTTVGESLLAANYTADTATMIVGAGTGVKNGDSLVITDGNNTDYFTAISVDTTKTILTVPTLSANGFTGVAHSYTTVSGTKVQVLKEQDPDNTPTAWCSSVDSVIRYGVKNIINLIDYSS